MRKLSILILAAALVVAVSSMVLAEDINDGFDVIINIPGFVEVDTPDSIIVDVTDLDQKATASGSFKVASNTEFSVEITSEGYGNALDDIVTYKVYGSENILTTGGNYLQADVPAGSYSGNFEVSVGALGKLKNWTEIKAKGYSDTISITISAD